MENVPETDQQYKTKYNVSTVALPRLWAYEITTKSKGDICLKDLAKSIKASAHALYR